MKRHLSDIEKEEILNDHIPYKLTQLRHHHYYKELFREKILIDNWELYRKHEICAIEIAFVAGRLFLEFMGLRLDKKSNQLVERPISMVKQDDLFITVFGCVPVKLNDLPEKDKKILAEFYNRASKGSGHFTWEQRERDGSETVDEGTTIIESLLKKHLYDKLRLELIEK
ncbi:MAG: hypothetical protein ACXWEY_05205 [Bacteroidia bacterium]